MNGSKAYRFLRYGKQAYFKVMKNKESKELRMLLATVFIIGSIQL